MKRIALSVFSAALLSVAITPLAQAASSPAQPSTQQSTTLSQVPSTLEQRRQQELDRTGNPGGSLNRPSPEAPADVERPQSSPSALEQRRLDELGRRNSPQRNAPADVERAGSIQTSRLHQRRLSHLNSK